MFFGVILEPGKQYQQEPDMPLHLSMATIQPATKQAGSAIVSVYCHSEENEKFLICSLHPENTYQVPLDLTFIEGQTVTLSTEGPGKVHLTGYYMPETEMDFDDEEDSDIDEEVESEDLDAEDVAETQKRPNAAKDVSGPAAKKVKVEVKNEAKQGAKKDAGKLNGQAARAIPAAGEDSDDGEDGADDDSGDDEEDLNELLADIKRSREKMESGAGDQMNVSANADGDDDDDDEDDADMDEEDSDEDDVAEQQKQLKQSLNKEPKQQNGGQVGKGAAKPQGKWQQDGKASGRPNQQFGGQQRGGGGHQQRGGGGFQQRGGGRGGFQKGGRGSPGNKSPGFRDQSRGRGGGTPFNKKRNFSPHGNSGQKAGGFGGKRS